MSDDNITLCTPYSGDAEEPCAKKLRVATEHTSLKVHSEPADGLNEYVSADNESSLTRKNGANPNIKEGCKDVGFTSNSFIGPLCQQESVDRKTVEIEDELDKFYKELEQIAPEDVDSIDDCNADKDANAQKQHSPVLQQEIQCDFVQSVWHHEPHSGQLLQNKPQTLEHLQPYSHYWDACLSPSQRSNSPYCGVTHTRSQRFLHQSPSPFLPPPPPRMVPYSLCDYGSRHNFRDQNQETFRWENNPTNSSHTNQGDKHFAHQDPYETVPNEIGCNGSYGSQLRCSQSHGKNSSFCQRNSEEYKFYQQAHTPPGQTADPYSFKLILMRGAPGSGKSTLARELLSSSPHGLILSTDDYFLQEDHYVYDSRVLGDAHHWNQNRTQQALCEYRSPIIIDNTNMQAWEMKPYVQMAVERGYIVRFCEPNTSWKFDPSELERRNKHGVSREKIAKMLERFELPITVDIVLNSQEPPRRCTEHAFKQPMKRRRDWIQ